MGHERFVMADTVVRLCEEFRADYVPSAKTWEAFELLLLLHTMMLVHQRGRKSSALGLSRNIGMPRTTVLRRLEKLKEMGAVEQDRARFTVLPEFMNVSHRIEGFKRRRDMWQRAAKKMSATDT
jgi:DNA-binding IclR family transcriptional regulator